MHLFTQILSFISTFSLLFQEVYSCKIFIIVSSVHSLWAIFVPLPFLIIPSVAGWMHGPKWSWFPVNGLFVVFSQLFSGKLQHILFNPGLRLMWLLTNHTMVIDLINFSLVLLFPTWTRVRFTCSANSNWIYWNSARQKGQFMCIFIHYHYSNFTRWAEQDKQLGLLIVQSGAIKPLPKKEAQQDDSNWRERFQISLKLPWLWNSTNVIRVIYTQ